MSKDVEIANIKEAMNGADNTKMITPYSLNQVIKRKAGSGSGTPGVGLNYYWNGTELGVKREDEDDYTFVDLKGAKGDKGDTGETGATGATGPAGVVAQATAPTEPIIWLDTTEDDVAYVRASQAEAEAGVDNQNYMTPLRTAQAIAALVGENIPDDLISSTGSATTVSKVWVGTQAQYDAIGTKSASTLYFIK